VTATRRLTDLATVALGDLGPVRRVLLPLFLMGCASGAGQQTWKAGGIAWDVEIVLLQSATICAAYVVLLAPLRKSAAWRAPRLGWQVGLAIALGSVVISLVALILLCLFGLWRTEPFSRWLVNLFTGGMPVVLFIPAVLVTGAALLEFSLAADARARGLHLRSELMLARQREARLKLLRLQLHPHFLFNALNSVASLLLRDRAAAAEMVARLQSLYGRSLRSLESELVPVADELDWCREYLAVEHQRFSDRLVVEVRLDPAVASALVPPLLLQPLVENAVRHGVAREPGAAWIQIAAGPAGDGTLLLRVANGARASGADAEGFGLRHTRRRLFETYGNRARLDLVRSGPQVEAMLRLPRIETDPADASLRAG
jgi:histidine kinase